MVVWAEVRTSVVAAVVVAVAVVVVVVGAGWWWCWTRSMSRRGDTLRSDDNQGNSLWGRPNPRTEILPHAAGRARRGAGCSHL